MVGDYDRAQEAYYGHDRDVNLAAEALLNYLATEEPPADPTVEVEAPPREVLTGRERLRAEVAILVVRLRTRVEQEGWIATRLRTLRSAFERDRDRNSEQDDLTRQLWSDFCEWHRNYKDDLEQNFRGLEAIPHRIPDGNQEPEERGPLTSRPTLTPHRASSLVSEASETETVLRISQGDGENAAQSSDDKRSYSASAEDDSFYVDASEGGDPLKKPQSSSPSTPNQAIVAFSADTSVPTSGSAERPQLESFIRISPAETESVLDPRPSIGIGRGLQATGLEASIHKPANLLARKGNAGPRRGAVSDQGRPRISHALSSDVVVDIGDQAELREIERSEEEVSALPGGQTSRHEAPHAPLDEPQIPITRSAASNARSDVERETSPPGPDVGRFGEPGNPIGYWPSNHSSIQPNSQIPSRNER